jgi:hypothetical protein
MNALVLSHDKTRIVSFESKCRGKPRVLLINLNDWRRALNRIFKSHDGRAWTGLIWLRIGVRGVLF